MNILYINTNPRNRLSDTAGYATHMLKTIKGFEAVGHHVLKLIAGDESEAQRAKNIYRGLKSRFPKSLSKVMRDVYEILHDIKLARSWYSIVADKKISFIYERMNSFHTCGYRLSKKLNVPLVLEINDPLRESVTVDFSILKNYAVFLEDYLVRHADTIILGSEALRNYFIDRGFNQNNLVVLYPTADTELFNNKLEYDDIKRKYKLDHKIVVGFVAGNVSNPRFKIELMIAALMRLSEKYTNLVGLIVGDGALNTIGHKSIMPDFAERIKITGKIPYADVPKYIAAMDICVIPNATWYGSPTKLFEYGVMGKAVIAAKFPPIEEIIEDGVTGLLFDPDNAIDLSEKIFYLLSNPLIKKALGANLKEKVLKCFTWEKNTNVIINIVNSLWENKYNIS